MAAVRRVGVRDSTESALDEELDVFVDQALTAAEFEVELEALRREISANWVSEMDAAAIVADQRR